MSDLRLIHRNYLDQSSPFHKEAITALFKKNALIALNKRLLTPEQLERMHHDRVLRLLMLEHLFNAFQSREVVLQDFDMIPMERLYRFDSKSTLKGCLTCFESERARSTKGIPNEYDSSGYRTQFGRDLSNAEYKAVKLLLDKNEPIEPEYDPMGFKMIHCAAMYGQCETIKLLLDIKPSDVDLSSLGQ